MSVLIRRSILGGILWGLLVGLAHEASADVSMDLVTWGTGGSTLGWTGTGDANSITSPASGGNPGGFLSVQFDAAFPGVYSEIVSNSGAGYTGNYGGLDLKFDLLGYSNSVQQLFFVSSAGGPSTWFLTLVDPPVQDQSWQTYSVSFKTQGSWYTGSSVQFLDALAQVDSIGLVITHFGSDTPLQYGLDNWQFLSDQSQLFVPEPGTTAMAAMLVLTLGLWARKLLPPRNTTASSRSRLPTA